MGSMSMSDAAPLPRLGEVFFDVRSPSRSLRISWYADTGVAVLSIWQGGTCTGSFRLPMGDLPRMIETLQRGPDGQGSPAGNYPPQPAGARTMPAAWVPGTIPARAARTPGRPRPPVTDAYAAGPGSLHYLNGSAPAHTRTRPGPATRIAPPPGTTWTVAAPAQYPDETGAGYPHPGPDRRRLSARRYPAHYPDDKYAREPYPAGLPGRSARRAVPGRSVCRCRIRSTLPAEPHPGDQYSRDPYPGDQYLNGAEPRDHSAQPAGIDHPHRRCPGRLMAAQPGMTGERAPGGAMPGDPATAESPFPNRFRPVRRAMVIGAMSSLPGRSAV